MVVKKRVCKECGRLTLEKECASCGSKQFVDKYKGTVLVLNAKESDIAKKLDIKDNGQYALKY